MQFTLRDIMAAMAVIGLALVLVPTCAVQSNRTPGRANTCRNNMRNLSLAMIRYETNRGHYPGYNNDLDPTMRGMPNNDRSWTCVILPYMDRRSLFDHIRNGHFPNAYDASGRRVAGGIDVDLEITDCPSMPEELRLPGSTVYVVNTGQLDNHATSHIAADFAANGVFHSGVARSPGDKLIQMSSRDIADGLGMTLMMSENLDARHWSDTAERWTGFTYHHASGTPGAAAAYPTDPLGINVLAGQSTRNARQNSALGFARSSSHHPGGVNMVFCDGHIRFISDKISYRIYQALMTPYGAEAVNNATPTGTPFLAGHAAMDAVDENDLNNTDM